MAKRPRPNVALSSLRVLQREPLVVHRVVGVIQEALINGEVRPGDCLPSENQLARQLGVSRASVREAIRMLVALGVVEVRRGSGNFVRTPPFEHGLIDPFIFRLILESVEPADLMELRTIFEMGYIGLAIDRMSPAQAQQLDRLTRELREAAERNAPVGELLELDVGFHLLLLECTGNRLMVRLGRMLLDLFRPSIRKALERNPWDAVIGHEEILECVLRRDVQGARDAVMRNLERWRRTL